MSTLTILDNMAAESARAMVTDVPASGQAEKVMKTAESLFAKALGITQEQGVFSAILFLATRNGSDVELAEICDTHLMNLTRSMVPTRPGYIGNQGILGAREYLTTHVTNDLSTLLSVKQAWELTLTYARDAAKAVRQQIRAAVAEQAAHAKKVEKG